MPETEKKPRFKLSPELVDGDHWSVVSTKSGLLEFIGIWVDNTMPEEGESFTVSIVYMTDQEVDALPEI